MDNQNLPYLYSPQVSQYTFIEESYSILYESLLDFMSKPEEMMNGQSTDFFEALLEKISYIKNSRRDDSKIVNEVNQLETDLYALVSKFILKDFPGDEGLLEDLHLNKKLIHLIYNKFYFNKRTTLKEFVLVSIFNNRKNLVKKYKDVPRKDISLNKIRSEVEDTKSANILFAYKEIVTEVLTSDNSIVSFLESITLEADDLDLLTRYFEYSNHTEVFKVATSNITDSTYFPDFALEVRLELQQYL